VIPTHPIAGKARRTHNTFSGATPMTRFTIAALLSVVSAASADAPTTADLSPGLLVGTTGSWVVTRTVGEDSKAVLAEGKSTTTTTLEFTTEVRSANGESGSTVEIVFSRIAATGDGLLWKGGFDSADPTTIDAANPDDFDRAFQGIVGKSIEIDIDPYGLVTEVRGLEALQNRDPAAANLSEAVLGVDILDRSLGPIFAIRPEQPYVTRLGESFEDTCDALLDVGRVLTRVELTLATINGDNAELTLAGNTQLLGVSATPVSPKVTDQSVKGEASWNTKTHTLNAYNLTIDWTVEAGGKELPIKISRAETITIAPKKK